MMFEAYLTQDAGHLDPDDIPDTTDPVWVLGKKYSAVDGEYDDVLDILLLCTHTHTHTAVVHLHSCF